MSPTIMSRRGFALGNSCGQYLVFVRRENGKVTFVWSDCPDSARIYPTIFEAKRQAKLIDQALTVWQVDESPTKYYFTSVS